MTNDVSIRLCCSECMSQWAVPISTPMEVDLFCKVLEGLSNNGCPQCGADEENIMLSPPDPLEPGDRPGG